jgi:predicted permease
MTRRRRPPKRRASPLDRRDEHDEEIRHHIAEKVDFLVSRGWEPDAAREEAMRQFGDAERIRSEMMAVRRDRRDGAANLLPSLVADLRYALRGVRANPAFVGAIVATLALGIGAAGAIFAVVDALLLRPMPYRDAERWVEVLEGRGDGQLDLAVSAERIPPLGVATEGALDGWVAFVSETLVRTDGPQAEALSVVAVTPGADTLLGIPLILGRAFTAEEARPGAPPVAILTHEYWKRTGADPQVVGRTLRLESGTVDVVGVVGRGIRFPYYGPARDLWIPLRGDYSYADSPPLGAVEGLLAHLASGVDLERAQERARAGAAAIQELNPPEQPWRVGLEPMGHYRANADDRRALWTLVATVGVLFVIALVNGVNLVLVRAMTRGREIAVRLAIGASRLRLLRQLLVEGLVLGVLGGAAAVGLAWLAVSAIRDILPSAVVYFSPHAFRVESRTLWFAFSSSLLVGALFGVLPWLQTLPSRGPGALAGRARGDDSTVGRRIRHGLVVTQVALSMTLLGAAGLLVHSFARLLAVDPGFEHERIALATIGPSRIRYPDGAARAEMVRRLEAALEAHPAIEAVTVSSGTGFSAGAAIEAEGVPILERQPERVPRQAVSEDFFQTMGVEIVEGRAFGPGDGDTDNAMVDADLARFLWPGRSPLGLRFRIGESGQWWTVVGVFGELALMGRDERDWPYQYLTPMSPDRVSSYVEIAMRTSGPPSALLPIFRETLRTIDAEQWIWRLRTASDALAEEEDDRRFVVTLMGLLATIALALAAVGLYGVLNYSVSRRSRELGIRMALGADRARVRGFVLAEGLVVTCVGIALGLAGFYLAARLVEQMLYEVEPGDPVTALSVTVVPLAVATVATLLPAIRATRVDPVEVLRAD